MELLYILIIDIFCIILGVIGLYKVPVVALFGLIISLTVILEEIVTTGITDVGILTLSICTIIICAVSMIMGFRR